MHTNLTSRLIAAAAAVAVTLTLLSGVASLSDRSHTDRLLARINAVPAHTVATAPVATASLPTAN